MSFILRYDSSTIPFTHLKCTIQWFSVYVLSFATIDSHFSKHFFRVNVCLWVNARPPIHTGIKLVQFGDLTFSGMHMWFIPGLRSMWKVVISGSLCLLRYSSPGANWKDRVAFMGAIVCRSYTPFILLVSYMGPIISLSQPQCFFWKGQCILGKSNPKHWASSLNFCLLLDVNLVLPPHLISSLVIFVCCLTFQLSSARRLLWITYLLPPGGLFISLSMLLKIIHRWALLFISIW